MFENCGEWGTLRTVDGQLHKLDRQNIGNIMD